MTHTGLTRRSVLRTTSALALPVLGAGALAACGDDDTGASGPVDMVFSAWGSPEEMKKADEFVAKFNAANSAAGKISMALTPVDSYKEKILTQLVGGNAPDIIAATDDFMAKLIESNAVVELGPLLDGADSKTKTSDFGAEAWGAAKTKDGRYFGITTDANPSLMWYNTKVLRTAGVAEEPSATFEAGKWTRDYFQNTIDKVVASGVKAFVVGSSWYDLYPWLTCFGGTVYQDGTFVAQDDATSVEALQWLVDLVKAKACYHVLNVPAGQGQDSLFMANNLAFTTEGRWVVPQYSKISSLETDVVHRPSVDGKMAVTATYTAFMTINKKAKNQDAAFKFLTEYGSVEGQTFRLGDGGVSVPSIKGADAVVTQGGYPKHAKYFTDAQTTAFPLPVEEARVPGLSAAIQRAFDEMFAKNGDAKTGLQAIAALANPAIEKGQLN
ncbi:extracellular solute-binding protein [Asanoa sp. NPDC050611]|uniref:extracellular solute-binding protein n=1 Tax=Asanoa sp. NPDC050611 TaxID=3157098 RepID=UPI0033E1BC3D